MKRGIDERGPIAAWLIRSREAFRVPGADRSWTVDDFLTALAAESGKAPARTTYARWESGAARPEPTSLNPIIAFYAARGIAGPGQAPVTATPVPDMATSLAALAAELREWRTADRDRIAGLETLVGSLAAQLQRAEEQLERLAPSAPLPPAG
jgi:hypothetical protein